MKLSVVVPAYDDAKEVSATVRAVRNSLLAPLDMEFVLPDVHECADSLPAAKNEAVGKSSGDVVFFLSPGIFPKTGAVEILLNHLRDRADLSAVCGRWSNAKGKVEAGYNVRRFPSFAALLFDILLINKLLPRNRFTRRFKMHDFDHNQPILVEHANDCVFLVRRDAFLRHGEFNEHYAPGWFDQLEFCQRLIQAGERILFEPRAEFVSNERAPLIDRLVEAHYVEYRRAEHRYIRNHFGPFSAFAARVCLAVGMLERMLFSITLPVWLRKRLLSGLGSYVDDTYIRSLRSAYWSVLKESLYGSL